MSNRANFGSRLGVILATAGSAVGLGNVWRFPYMAGENGGAAFIILYIVCVLLLGIPCMMAEFVVGRHGQANVARSYGGMGAKGPWALIGYMGVMTGFLIISYYAVVSGWCMHYVFASLLGNMSGSPEYFVDYFSEFSADPVKPVFWTAVILLLSTYIVAKGVQGGIERASKLLMPCLFILLLIIVVASLLLPGSGAGVSFMLKPDFSAVDHKVMLGALGQSFFSMSIGMGALATYSSYFSKKENLLTSSVQIASIDTLVAILAGMMIFPAAFSVGIKPDSGASLVFITLPNVFQQAFGGVPLVGHLVSVMFYGLLTVAAITSLISLHEVNTAFMHEELHVSRRGAALSVALVAIVIGTFCSLSLGAVDGLTLFGKSLFDCFDFITGQVLLPLGGFLTSILLGWFVPKKVVRDEFTNRGTVNAGLFKVFVFLLRYVCPLGILLVFLNQLGVIGG